MRKQTKEKLLRQIKNGDAEAMYTLGFAYYTGKYGKVDLEGAIDLFRQGAMLGNVQSMQALGICYANGDGIKKDLTKAVFWYQKAVDAGFDQALYNLALCYYRGEGVTVDEVKGKQLMEQAAKTDRDAKKFLNRVYKKKSMFNLFRREK